MLCNHLFCSASPPPPPRSLELSPLATISPGAHLASPPSRFRELPSFIENSRARFLLQEQKPVLHHQSGQVWYPCSGGGCTNASIACGNLTPYLCYGALSRSDRTKEIFQMHKTKFFLRTVTFWRYGAKSSGPRYKLKSASVCQQRPLVAVSHGRTTPKETSQFYRRGAACSYSCSYL